MVKERNYQFLLKRHVRVFLIKLIVNDRISSRNPILRSIFICEREFFEKTSLTQISYNWVI